MKLTLATLVCAAAGCLLIGGDVLAQVFAQAAPAAQPPATTPGAPPAAGARIGGLATPPPAAVAAPPSGGGFIRAGSASAGRPGGADVFFYNKDGGPTGFGGGRGGWGFSFGGDAGDDPEIAKLNESENELAQQSHQLISDYSQTDDYQKRESLKKQLREVLAKQFDAQRQRREKELEQVEKRLARVRDQLKKRNDSRETIIDRRLESLVSDAEGLGWTPPAGSGPSGPGGLAPAFARPLGAAR
jgi:hypothetical protein